MDDFFVIFESEIQVKLFKKFMNTCHPKMKFTITKEQYKRSNFSDVKVVRENNVFTTSVYRKLTFSGVSTHFDSYIPVNDKVSLISTITFCSFTICSDMHKFHQEICEIKDIFIKNSYSEQFIDKRVKTFFNKLVIPGRITQTAEKEEATIVLPYMAIISTELT